MIVKVGFGQRGCFDLKPVLCAAIVSVAAAGCSADVTRFDSTSFNLNDPPEESAASVSQEPERSASDFQNPVTRSTPSGPYGAGARDVGLAALPEPIPVAAAPSAPVPRVAAAYRPATPAAAPAPAAPIAKGESIEVAPGDTLYGLSKRHQVSLNELMTVNALTSPNLKPGQKLYLPAGKAAAANTQLAAATPANVPAAPAPAEAAPAPMALPSADVAAKYTGSYVVKPGDSLYQIARAHKVQTLELQQVNAITDPRKVKPGATLKVPGGSTVAALEPSATAPAPATPAAAPAPVAAAPSVPATSVQPAVINKPAEVPAAAAPVTPSAPMATGAVKGDKLANAAPQAAAQASDTTKLRWPAQGKVIAGFGGRPDGTHNDGINISVPLGTDVHSAEAGVVAYAGSELKGYGNLILVRHDNGWVTAYAHNEEMLVKRGDKVRRGQVIGKAGKTGTVDQPQVHFELRQGSKPVDPTPFMEKL